MTSRPCRAALPLLSLLLASAPVAAADPATPVAPAPVLPEKLPPARLGIGDLGTVQFSLGVQLVTAVTADEAEAGDGLDFTETLQWRRVRWRTRVSLLDGRLGAYAQINTVPGAVELLDLYGDWRFGPMATLRLGQETTPFTRYRQRSFADLDLVDWAITTRAFGAERQIGAMMTNTLGGAPRIEYAAGVFTGQNARRSHGIGLWDAYGEKATNPSDLVNPAPLEPIHPELMARVGHLHVDPDARLQHAFSVSGAWDARPVHAHDLAWRVAPEATLAWRDLGLTLVGYVAGFEDLEEVSHLGLWGALAEPTWRPTRHVGLALRYAHVERLPVLLDDATETCAQHLAEGLVTSCADPIAHAADQELAAGVNVYVIGNNLKWQTDLAQLSHPGEDSSAPEYRLRSQMQLLF